MTSFMQISGDALEFLDCGIRLLRSKSVTEFFNRQVEIIGDAFEYFTQRYGALERLENLPDISTYPCDSDIDRVISLRHREIVARGVQQIKRDLGSSGINKIEITQIRQALELALRRLSLPPVDAAFLMNRLEMAYVKFNMDNDPKITLFRTDHESVVVNVFGLSILNASDPKDVLISLINKTVEILSLAIRSSVAYAISALPVAATVCVLAHMLEYNAQELYPILQDCLSSSSAASHINVLEDLSMIVRKSNIVNFSSIYQHRLSNLCVREIPFE